MVFAGGRAAEFAKHQQREIMNERIAKEGNSVRDEVSKQRKQGICSNGSLP